MKLADLVENNHLVRDVEQPDMVMLGQGYYMQQRKSYERGAVYEIRRLMEEETVAKASMLVSMRAWTFMLVDPAAAPSTMIPPSADFFDSAKFKQFVIENMRLEKLMEGAAV